MSLLIPILSITLSLAALIVWIIARHRREVQQLENRHRERMAAIEKGLELPPEAPLSSERPDRIGLRPAGASRYLLRGLVCVGVGLGVSLTGRDMEGLGSWGWIVVGVGAAYLIFYFVEARRGGANGKDSGHANGRDSGHR